MVLHYMDVKQEYQDTNVIKSQAKIFGDVLKRYPMSLCVSLFSFLLGLGVFALLGFHIYILSIGYST